MMRRPDGPAIVGLLVLAGVLGVGALVLVGVGRDVPVEVWPLVAAAVGAVGGWVGKTATGGGSGATDTGTAVPAAPVVQGAPVVAPVVASPAVSGATDRATSGGVSASSWSAGGWPAVDVPVVELRDVGGWPRA